VDVVFVRWPREAARRDQLALAGVPRLLLVDADAAPPDPVDCMEDWARVPCDEADILSRAAGVARRSDLHAAPLPNVDADGVLRFGTRWASLPPVEARLVAPLVDRFGSVVGRDVLARAGWPDGAPGRNALDVHVLRLRRRLGPMGLAIRTVRSRGYLLEAAELRLMRDGDGREPSSGAGHPGQERHDLAGSGQ
jgi:two-component system OmpR family response regulator